MSLGMVLERDARRQASSSAIALDTNRFSAYREALPDRKPWEVDALGRFVVSLAAHQPIAFGTTPEGVISKGDATASALQQARFATPASLLVESIKHVAKLAQAAPSKYRIPTPETLAEAIHLLAHMPAEIEMPEPAAEPSGAIAYSWDRDDAFLVLAVDGSGQVQVSHIFDEVEGVTRINLTNPLSPDLLQLLTRFRVSHA